MLFNNVYIIIDVRWAYQNHNLDVKRGKECALVKILHMWGYKAKLCNCSYNFATLS